MDRRDGVYASVESIEVSPSLTFYPLLLTTNQQGMPGRVFRSQVPEYREDVASLDSTLFLRKVRDVLM